MEHYLGKKFKVAKLEEQEPFCTPFLFILSLTLYNGKDMIQFLMKQSSMRQFPQIS